MYSFILFFFNLFFLIGTSQGAALINLESRALSWVCRSKSDIFSQQFDQSVILDITPTFLRFIFSSKFHCALCIYLFIFFCCLMDACSLYIPLVGKCAWESSSAVAQLVRNTCVCLSLQYNQKKKKGKNIVLGNLFFQTLYM